MMLLSDFTNCKISLFLHTLLIQMPSLPDVDINDFDYLLPDEKIAKYPLNQRDQSKLLIYKNQTISESVFKNLPGMLPSGSLLIFNNTRVIHARLLFKKETGATIEIFCLEPYQPSDYYQIFETTNSCSWVCMIGNKRKWKSGALKTQMSLGNKTITLTAKIKGSLNDSLIIMFVWDGGLTFGEILDNTGHIPIPPYLHRQSEKIDFTRYQTVYSDVKGSVAAPTAGLHFTPELLEELQKHNIYKKNITLHVGAGTFQPVKAKKIQEHSMHIEKFAVHIDTLKALLHSKNTIAVGTTSLRTLESICHLATKIINGMADPKNEVHLEQWEPYESELPDTPKNVLQELIDMMQSKQTEVLRASTQIFIAPGYSFTLSDGLITNFHLPKSTLLLLIAALVGDAWKDIYRYALDNNFRFLSYGDGSLLFPGKANN